MVRAGHLHRDPNSDTAEPDPKLPAPTCLVNITWIVARAEPDRSETRQTARARRPPLQCLTLVGVICSSRGALQDRPKRECLSCRPQAPAGRLKS